MLAQIEVRPAVAYGFTSPKMCGDVIGSQVPRCPAVLGRYMELIAKWTLYRLRWFFSTKMALAMDIPGVLMWGDV
jgi:hypothetical protein